MLHVKKVHQNEIWFYNYKLKLQNFIFKMINDIEGKLYENDFIVINIIISLLHKLLII